MEFLATVSLMIGRVLMETFTSPLFILLFLILFLIITWQYKRLENMSAKMVNINKNRYLRSAVVSSLLGVIGGIIGTVLLVLIGIDLSSIGIMQLWIIALLLMVINPRFLCFAYAGGVLSIASLFLGYPQISIPQLMALVAILHIIESVLILVNGRFNPVPVYVQKANRITGGFNLQKFWPIPLIALISTGIAEPGAGIAMPDWWPIIKDYSGFIEGQSYTLIPVVAILGYGEVATTAAPDTRVKKSALHLLVFSIVLLFLSILSSKWPIFMIIAALFSPLGHEFVIWLGLRDEINKKPLYVNPQKGLMVMDIKPGTWGAKMGIASKDILLSINGEPVEKFFMGSECTLSRGKIVIEVLRDKELLKLSGFFSQGSELGIIMAPNQNTKMFISIGEDNIFNLVRSICRRLKITKY